MTGASLVLRGALAGVLVVVAALLTVFTVDVLRWPGQLERAHVHYAARSSDATTWEPETTFPTGLSRRLLALDDDVAFGRALERFRVFARTSNDELVDRGLLLTSLELELERLADTAAGSPQRSQALNLHALVLFREMYVRGSNLYEQTLRDLRRAILLDPTNAQAKYNLEFVLRIVRVLTPVGLQLPVAGARRGERSGNRGGAGAGHEGSGF